MDKNKISITEITEQLMSLKESGVVGIKQSFEDEGVILEDVLKIKRLCDKLDLKLNVKIGGCEAISDINNCLSLEASGIVAPMIESEFALEKFVESIISNTNDQDRSSIDFFINIESKSAIQNLDKILSSPSSKLLKGIVVGRSDLTKSFGYGKQDVNSKEICEIVKNTFKEAKSFKFTTIMGGNIGHSSTTFIEELVAVIAGADRRAYSYDAPRKDGSWRNFMLDELKGKVDLERIYFTGLLDYEDYRKLLWRSDLHCYFTRPYVTSWSLFEAAGCGAKIVCNRGEATCGIGEEGTINWVNLDKIEEMARAMSMLIKEGTSRAELKKDFNLDNALKKWERLLNKTLKERF